MATVSLMPSPIAPASLPLMPPITRHVTASGCCFKVTRLAAKTPVHLSVFADPISPDGLTVAALGVDDRVWLYPVNGGAATIVPALAAGEAPLIWSRDGHSLFTLQWQGAAHVRVHKVDLRTQRRTLVRSIAPPIPGLMSILHLQAAVDADAYVYTYMQRLSDLYVVNGVR